VGPSFFLIIQLCTGIDEKSVGSSFQLVFAPIDEHFPDDALLISSGFRVIPLDMKTVSIGSSFPISFLIKSSVKLVYVTCQLSCHTYTCH
jgi:hypothetical protein